MKNELDFTREHYELENEREGLVSKVTRALDAMGQSTLSTSQLAGLDQFHVGGLAATRKLAELAGIQPWMKILDAGSGLGGPSRYLAETYGCSVAGLDLIPSFVAVAELLAKRSGLSDRVSYAIGDLIRMSFPDESFDLVWTQHVVMNISRREQLYGEFCRVLKPTGKLAFFDVIAAGDGLDLHFPLPWASNSEMSFLMSQPETISTLELAGFEIVLWNDVTSDALNLLGKARASTNGELNLATAMGQRFTEMLLNLAHDVLEGRLRLVMAICDRRAHENSL